MFFNNTPEWEKKSFYGYNCRFLWADSFLWNDSKKMSVKLQGRGKPSKVTKDGNSSSICALELEIITENVQ